MCRTVGKSLWVLWLAGQAGGIYFGSSVFMNLSLKQNRRWFFKDRCRSEAHLTSNKMTCVFPALCLGVVELAFAPSGALYLGPLQFFTQGRQLDDLLG